MYTVLFVPHARIIGSGLRNWRLNFLSITFKLGCCGSKIEELYAPSHHFEKGYFTLYYRIYDYAAL